MSDQNYYRGGQSEQIKRMVELMSDQNCIGKLPHCLNESYQKSLNFIIALCVLFILFSFSTGFYIREIDNRLKRIESRLIEIEDRIKK